MKSVIISHKYSELDKRHEFGIQLDSLPAPYINWVWFGIGQGLPLKTKLEVYPYLIKGKVIYSSKPDPYKTSADVLGRRIAKKILEHFEKIA